jgi:hypothetical protein
MKWRDVIRLLGSAAESSVAGNGAGTRSCAANFGRITTLGNMVVGLVRTVSASRADWHSRRQSSGGVTTRRATSYDSVPAAPRAAPRVRWCCSIPAGRASRSALSGAPSSARLSPSRVIIAGRLGDAFNRAPGRWRRFEHRVRRYERRIYIEPANWPSLGPGRLGNKPSKGPGTKNEPPGAPVGPPPRWGPGDRPPEDWDLVGGISFGRAAVVASRDAAASDKTKMQGACL